MKLSIMLMKKKAKLLKMVMCLVTNAFFTKIQLSGETPFQNIFSKFLLNDYVTVH